MAPRPLKSAFRHHDNPHVYVTRDVSKAVSERPQMAVLAMQVIALSSETESLLVSALVTALGTKAEPAVAMVSALTSSQAQIAALQAAMATVLTGESREIFEAAVSVIKKAQKHRHILAHWLWAYSDALPDDVILIDPKKEAAFHLKLSNSILTGDDKKADPVQALTEGSMVYSPKDFHQFLEEARDAMAISFDLGILCWGETSPQAEKARHRLLSVPGIQKQMARGKRDWMPNQEPPP